MSRRARALGAAAPAAAPLALAASATVRGVGPRVEIEQKGDPGPTVRQTDELSPDGSTLIATLRFAPPRAPEPILARSVYVRSEDESEP